MFSASVIASPQVARGARDAELRTRDTASGDAMGVEDREQCRASRTPVSMRPVRIIRTPSRASRRLDPLRTSADAAVLDRIS
jgi:hypothetical protein